MDKILYYIENLVQRLDLSSSSTHRRTSIESDEQLVENALRRQKRRRFDLEDLFYMFGPWNRYFQLVILLSGVMLSITFFEVELLDLVTLPGKNRKNIPEFNFYDCNHTLYREIRKAQEDFWHDENNKDGFQISPELFIIGNFVGPIVCLLLHRRSPQYIIGMLSIMIFFIRLGESVSVFVPSILSQNSGTFIETVGYIAVLRYFGAALPDYLIPFGMFMIYRMHEIAVVAQAALITFSKNPQMIMIITAPLYLVGGLLFSMCAPPPILDVLVKQETKVLKNLIAKYTTTFRPDIEALVDDIVYREGRTAISSWVIGFKVYLVRVYLYKHIFLFYMHAITAIYHYAVVDRIIKRHVMRDIHTGTLVSSFVMTVTDLVGLLLVYKFGCRKSLLTAITFGTVGLLIVFIMPHKPGFNTVRTFEDTYPEHIHIAFMCYLLTATSFSTTQLVIDSILIKGFPIEHHAILLPAHFFVRSFVDLVMKTYTDELGVTTERLDVDLFNLPSFLMFVIGGILAIFICDPCGTLLTTGDCQQLAEKILPYTNHPFMDDDTIFEDSDESGGFFKIFKRRSTRPAGIKPNRSRPTTNETTEVSCPDMEPEPDREIKVAKKKRENTEGSGAKNIDVVSLKCTPTKGVVTAASKETATLEPDKTQQSVQRATMCTNSTQNTHTMSYTPKSWSEPSPMKSRSLDIVKNSAGMMSSETMLSEK